MAPAAHFFILGEGGMQCQNYLCIYESNGACTLKEISLNISGTCDDCVYPSFDAQYLKREKKKLLKKFLEEDNSGTGD